MKLRKFKYEVLTSEGKLAKGQIETLNKYTCVKFLESKNYQVQKLTEVNSFLTKLNQIVLSSAMSKSQLIFYLKQLGSLLRAGIDILAAHEILALQQDNKYVRRLLFEVNQDINNGLSYSESLSKHPREFPKMLIQMIEIGEISGTLSETVLKMAVYFEDQTKLTNSIKSAVRMPLIYLGLTLLIAVGMILFVFPNITTLFASLGNAELPPITQLLLDIGDFASKYTLVIVLSITSFVLLIFMLNKYVPKVHYAFAVLLIKTPVFGNLIQMNNQILIANSLSQMLGNGVNSIYALETIKELLSNVVYKDLISKTVSYIKDGSPFSKAFKESEYVDPIMSRMISTGETTGDIPSLMTNLSIYYNETSEIKINRLKGTLQPVLLIIVYTVIGFLLLAIMLPMMSLGSQI